MYLRSKVHPISEPILNKLASVSLSGEALFILSRLGPRGAFAFETVRDIAADEATDFVLRESAIWTLEEFGASAKPAIPLLRTLSGHHQGRVREAATKALTSLEKQ